jgi:hypothetical protein
MALLRFRLANIIVAVLRSTALRRVVDGLPGPHRYPHGETSSSLHPDVHTVRPHPSGLWVLRVDVGAPPTAQERSGATPLVCRGQKTVERTSAREVDRPFRIITGTGYKPRNFEDSYVTFWVRVPHLAWIHRPTTEWAVGSRGSWPRRLGDGPVTSSVAIGACETKSL